MDENDILDDMEGSKKDIDFRLHRMATDKTIKTIQCTGCKRPYIMPDEFIGSILCEDCDPAMNPISKEDARKIRNYFGENDKTVFEHWAYDILNKKLKGNIEKEIESIGINESNLEHIANTGNINGSLLESLRRFARNICKAAVYSFHEYTYKDMSQDKIIQAADNYAEAIHLGGVMAKHRDYSAHDFKMGAQWALKELTIKQDGDKK